MPEVKIGVSGNPNAAKSAVENMTAAVNDLAKAVAATSKVPFKPVGVAEAAKDLAKLNKGFTEAIKQSSALRNALRNSGQNGAAGILNIDWSRMALDPKQAQRLRDRSFVYSAKNTAWDTTNVPQPEPGSGGGRSGGGSGAGGGGGGGRSGNEDRPRRSGFGFGGRLLRSFSSGVGGPVSSVANEGIDGAEAGAASGGALGGVGGLMKGLAAGAIAAGVYKLGSAVVDGYNMDKSRNSSLDNLKRQMGDLGVSFEALKAMSDSAAAGLGINARDFANLELQFNQASHGADRTEGALRDDTNTAGGLARAFGMDPSQAIGFFAGMKSIDSRQNNKELAALIAEATDRTGGRALATDVMQAVQSIAASTSRLSLSMPNLGAVASSYASLMNNGGAMSADAAAGLLGQANASFSRMGVNGEAGQNFFMQAFNAEGGPRLNPIAARALAAGGMFSSRRDVFSDPVMKQYFGNDPSFAALSQGPGADVMSLQAVRDRFDKTYAGMPNAKWWEADAVQNTLGLSSPQQAMALMNMNPNQYGGLGKMLNSAHVSMNDVNAGGLATLARLSNANSRGDLNAVYSDLKGRTGTDSLSDADRRKLDAVQANGTDDQFKQLLAQVTAQKNQQETAASDARRSAAALDNIKMSVGDDLIGPINTIKDAMLSVLGHFGMPTTQAGMQAYIANARASEAIGAVDEQKDKVNSAANHKIQALRDQQTKITGHTAGDWFGDLASKFDDPKGPHGTQSPAYLALQAQINALEADRASQLKDLDTRRGGYLGDDGKRALIAADEKSHNLPRGMLLGVWGAESSFGKNTGRNSYGAEGNYQMIDDTAKRYGVQRGDFDSETDGAASMLSDLLKKHGGDVKAALYEYNGVVHNTKSGDDYVQRVREMGGMTGQIPQPDDMSIIEEKAPVPSKASQTGITGSQDHIVLLRIDGNFSSNNGNGSSTTHNIQTEVPVPRGAGVTEAQVSY